MAFKETNQEEILSEHSASAEERIYVASHYQLMLQRFRKHKLAVGGAIVVLVFYLIAIFCEFIAPYDPTQHHANETNAPPHSLRFVDEEGNFHLRPFIYKRERTLDRTTFRYIYEEDTDTRLPIHFFVRVEPYRLWGAFDTNLRLFGVSEGRVLLFGADRLGRDMFSRIMYGTRISMSIGLIGVLLSFFLGIIIGGFSGYYGGTLDNFVQRMIEFLRSIPTIPLWLALSAALPEEWTSLQIYFSITVILSLIGWTTLARVVRGKFLSLREEDFVVAARLAGTSEIKIIMSHLLPSFLSHVIAAMTLAIPQMILAETALSFLGLGLRPPVVSWGVLLEQAQNIETVAHSPWLLLPGIFVIIAVLSFNFLGDGLRDAADPYSDMA